MRSGREGNVDIPDEPDETFCSGVFLDLQLVDDELLEGGRFFRSSVLPFSYFLESCELSCSRVWGLKEG